MRTMMKGMEMSMCMCCRKEKLKNVPYVVL